jgi:hypothetical protein
VVGAGAADAAGAAPLAAAVGRADAAGAPLAAAGAALAAGAVLDGAFAGCASAGRTPADAVATANQKANTERFMFPRLKVAKCLRSLFTRSPGSVSTTSDWEPNFTPSVVWGKELLMVAVGPRPHGCHSSSSRSRDPEFERICLRLTGRLAGLRLEIGSFRPRLPARNTRRNCNFGAAARSNAPLGRPIGREGRPEGGPQRGIPLAPGTWIHGRRPG